MIKLIIVSLSIIILFSSDFEYPHGWDELQTDIGWEVVNKTDRVKVFSKVLDVSPLPAYKVEMVSDLSVERLIDVAWSVENSVEIFPNAYIVDAGIYKQLNDTNYIAFQEFDIPFLSSRLYQFNTILKNNKIYWVRVDSLNPVLNLEKKLLPPVNFGSWNIKKIQGKSKIIYRVCTDPGGNIPLWIVEQANQFYLPLMLIDLEDYAKIKN